MVSLIPTRARFHLVFLAPPLLVYRDILRILTLFNGLEVLHLSRSYPLPISRLSIAW